jgi:hypothetical protein
MCQRRQIASLKECNGKRNKNYINKPKRKIKNQNILLERIEIRGKKDDDELINSFETIDHYTAYSFCLQ